MLLCDELEFSEWRPNFSTSEQTSPRWTRVRAAGVELFNGLEWVDWGLDDAGESTIQAELCDACGHTGCASGGYVRLSRLGRFVVWTAPVVDETDDWATAQYEAPDAVRRHVGLLIPEPTWATLAEHDRHVPATSRLAATTVRDLERAWISPVRSSAADDLSAVVERALCKVVAVSEGDEESARQHVRSLARWFESMRDSPAEGELVRAGQDVWPVVLYLDSGRGPDEWKVGSWPAFGLREDEALPVFGDWILAPPKRNVEPQLSH